MIPIAKYFISFLWGIFILLAMVGWGGIINAILFSKHRVDWGQRSAWGIALSVSIGGILNLTGSISPTAIFIYLGIGFAYFLIEHFQSGLVFLFSQLKYVTDKRKDNFLIIGGLAVGLLVLFQYAGWVYTTDFNIHDDFHGYFVFPNKMLQTGSLGIDPFSERRIAASLGGQAFLHTFVLSFLSEENLNIIDPGLAYIMLAGLLLAYAKKKKISSRIILAVIALPMVIPLEKVNITSLLIPLVLFVSLFRIFDWDELDSKHTFSIAVIVALVSAAICALKSSLIPACGIIVISSYIVYINSTGNKGKAIIEMIAVGILTLLFLLPWMLSMFQSSGTLLYPLLGSGYHGSSYATFFVPFSGDSTSRLIMLFFYLITDLKIIAFILLATAAHRLHQIKPNGRGAAFSLSLGSFLGLLIIVAAVTGYHYSRYSYPFITASIFISIILVLSTMTDIDSGNHRLSLSILLVISLLLGNAWYDTRKMYMHQLKNIMIGITYSSSIVSDDDISQYSRMQQSIPESEIILERLAKPFLLDFTRNNIFIIDYPGGASPPPGMPSFRGAEALSEYLLSLSIRYIAYSYATEAGFSRERESTRLNEKTNPWIRAEAEHTFDFQDNLIKLSKTKNKIYDDSDIFVIDLLN